jgi:integrase
MMTFALEKELIELHPLLKLRLIPKEEFALRVLTLQEERKLVESMPSLVSQAYVAILGETGLRMTEGFTLKWELVDLKNRLLTVEKTKGRKARTIPSLSDYAMEWLELLPKDSPYVFTCPSTVITTCATRWRSAGRRRASRGLDFMISGISGQHSG